MNEHIHGYILGSVYEVDRQRNISALMTIMPSLVFEEAIYPRYEKIPFINRLQQVSCDRTGHRLKSGEIGCMLSHRRIWRKIANHPGDNGQMFLVLESDSRIQDPDILARYFEEISRGFDLFFWGAWEGHMKLFRSTKKTLSGRYKTGTPFIRSVYCTYGYSLNKKAAFHLLRNTCKVAYPIDQFKRFIDKDALRMGGITPELITTTGLKKSYIRETRSGVQEFFIRLILDAKNSLICLFK